MDERLSLLLPNGCCPRLDSIPELNVHATYKLLYISIGMIPR